MRQAIRRLPPLRLRLADFEKLPEYSASLPTGTTIGKRWRRLDGAHDPDFLRAGGKPAWMIGQYTRDKIISAYRDERLPGGVGDIDPANPKGPLIHARCRIRAVTEITWFRPVIRVPAGSSPRASS